MRPGAYPTPKTWTFQKDYATSSLIAVLNWPRFLYGGVHLSLVVATRSWDARRTGVSCATGCSNRPQSWSFTDVMVSDEKGLTIAKLTAQCSTFPRRLHRAVCRSHPLKPSQHAQSSLRSLHRTRYWALEHAATRVVQDNPICPTTSRRGRKLSKSCDTGTRQPGDFHYLSRHREYLPRHSYIHTDLHR